MTPDQYAADVRKVFEICERLRAATGRPITPDGHMVGGLGEAFVDTLKNLTRSDASTKGIDGYDQDGHTIQIKTTTRGRITLSGLEPGADLLAAVQLDRNSGVPELIYYGKAQPAWELGGDRRKQGQWTLSLRYLAALPDNECPDKWANPVTTIAING